MGDPAGLTDQQIQERETQLMAHVPMDSPIGNVTLRRQLTDPAWTDDLYWTIRNRLISSNELLLGRGKGGSVRRAHPGTEAGGDALPQGAETSEAAATAKSERHLYEPMLNVIQGDWSKNERLGRNVYGEITAYGGKRPDGIWSRPDITLASYTTYDYVPGYYFNVITFEIKPEDSVDIRAVYEALAHRRAATHAYVLLQVPPDRREGFGESIEEIVEQARRLGIGVIIAGDPGNFEEWEELAGAVRHEPDPERLSDFLTHQISSDFRTTINGWIGTSRIEIWLNGIRTYPWINR